MEGVVSMPRPANCLQFTDEQFAALDEETRRALITIYTKKRECSEEDIRLQREVVIGVDNPYWPPNAHLPDDPGHPDICKLRPMRIFHDPSAALELMEYGLRLREKKLRPQREALQRWMQLQEVQRNTGTNHPGETQEPSVAEIAGGGRPVLT